MHDGSFMTETDAFSWRMEVDPELRSTVIAVAWLDSAPDWDRLTDKLDRAVRQIPVFCRRAVDIPGRVAPPRWAPPEDFDLSWHLRRVAAPPPATDEVVLDLTRVAAMAGFDRSRPLWEFTLVEGLEAGRAALIMKMHHALADGIGDVELGLLLFESTPEGVAPGRRLPVPLGRAPGAVALLGEAVAHDSRRVGRMAATALNSAVPTARRAVEHPFATARDVVGMATSIGRTVAPVSSTRSPCMTARGSGRRLHMMTVPTDRLKAAAAALEGTLNDAFMTSVTGGLRLYHELHEAPVDELLVTLPISTRTAEDPAAGNRITLQRFSVPVGITNVTERAQALGDKCRQARAERSLHHANAIAGVLNRLPVGAIGSMLKHVDFVASNVPGFPGPMYLAGARISGIFPFGPTIGAALNVTLFSYAEICCIGVTVDTSAVPDHGRLADCLEQGFAEVLALVPAPASDPTAVPASLG
ncbi:MAG TPA: wax ester/triacylglycerol synthase domain-containing protein [Acidimicrobiales bacterium]|nr:wax ester/triacylglycerol synthase domain-containing protein [Acidimicrobiales bacterium]